MTAPHTGGRPARLRFAARLAPLQLDLALLNLRLALRAYDPNQPRVPAGQPGGGRWAGGGGSGDVDATGGTSRTRLAENEPHRPYSTASVQPVIDGRFFGGMEVSYWLFRRGERLVIADDRVISETSSRT